jgi:hypothetical protein
MFRAHRAHHQERQIVSIPLVTVTLCQCPYRVQVGSEIFRAPGARKIRVKNKNKYVVKNCAPRWSFTRNHYMMHGNKM